DDVESYALLNLYTGLRDPDGRWELSLFAKNVFDKELVLTSGAAPLSTGLRIGATSASFTAPYHSVTVLPERELGVSPPAGGVRVALNGSYLVRPRRPIA